MALPADRVAVAAIYKDGALEIRIPEPKHEPAKKTAISQTLAGWEAGAQCGTSAGTMRP